MGGSNCAGDAKRALDTAMLGIGRLVAETLMVHGARREIWAGLPPDVVRTCKWASRGSIYIGDQKIG